MDLMPEASNPLSATHQSTLSTQLIQAGPGHRRRRSWRVAAFSDLWLWHCLLDSHRFGRRHLGRDVSGGPQSKVPLDRFPDQPHQVSGWPPHGSRRIPSDGLLQHGHPGLVGQRGHGLQGDPPITCADGQVRWPLEFGFSPSPSYRTFLLYTLLYSTRGIRNPNHR